MLNLPKQESNEIQPELFDQFTDDQLKPKQRFYRRIIRKRLPPHWTFTLSYENVIVSIIVLISLLIVSFSWGIERGKKNFNSSISLSADTAVVKVIPVANDPVFVPGEEKLPSVSALIGGPRLSPQVKTEKKRTGLRPVPTTYAIQVVTFKQQALAEKEVARLTKLNYNSFSKVRGKFRPVFVGSYATKELARQDLKKLRKIYKDCFIKRIANKRR